MKLRRVASGLAGKSTLAILFAFGFLASTNLGLLRLPAGFQFSGFAHADVAALAAAARELFENGNGLAYGDPFSASAYSPRVHSFLLPVLLGWSWHLTGLPLWLVVQIAQLAICAFLLISLDRTVRNLAPAPARSLVYWLAVVGGGGAVLQALLMSGLAADAEAPLRAAMRSVARGTTGVLAACYRVAPALSAALCLTGFWAWLEGRSRLALAAITLACWADPAAGAASAATVAIHGTIEAARRREPRAFAAPLIAFAIGAAFVTYAWSIVPGASAEAAAGLASLRRKADPGPGLVVLWGIFLVSPLLLLHRSTRPLDASDARDRFLLVWLFAALALALCEFSWPSLPRPLRFDPVLVLLPMILVGGRALVRVSMAWPIRARQVAAAAALTVASLDVLFLGVRSFVSSERIVLSPVDVELANFFERQPDSDLIHLVPRPNALPLFLLSSTPHRVWFVSLELTPFPIQKLPVMNRFLYDAEQPAQLAAAHGVRWIVGSARVEKLFDEDVDAGRARIATRAGSDVVIEILVPIHEAQPHPIPIQGIGLHRSGGPTRFGDEEGALRLVSSL